MADVRIDWHGDKILRMVRGKAHDRIVAAGEHLASKIEEKLGISTEMAGPSQPGEPPHKVSGDLERSIFSEAVSQGVVHVGSTSDHALELEVGTSEISPRPFLVDTLYEEAAGLGLKVGRS